MGRPLRSAPTPSPRRTARVAHRDDRGRGPRPPAAVARQPCRRLGLPAPEEAHGEDCSRARLLRAARPPATAGLRYRAAVVEATSGKVRYDNLQRRPGATRAQLGRFLQACLLEKATIEAEEERATNRLRAGPGRRLGQADRSDGLGWLQKTIEITVDRDGRVTVAETERLRGRLVPRGKPFLRRGGPQRLRTRRAAHRRVLSGPGEPPGPPPVELTPARAAIRPRPIPRTDHPR